MMGIIFVDAVCPECNGDGHIEEKQCPRCGGYGMIGYCRELPDTEYDDPSAFAQRLRRTRETRKVSMSDLAAQFGISVVELSHVERGRLEPLGELKEQITRWVCNVYNS